MNKNTKMAYRGRTLGLGLTLLAAAFLTPQIASAQSGTSSSGVQKPYIMILMDTSGSMEWTDEGDEQYPNRDLDGDEDGANEWQAHKEILPNGENQYGPCYIWDYEGSCDDYQRPAWTNNSDWTQLYEGNASSGAVPGRMVGRYNSMKNGGDRLHNYSQPRHVTLKEILTGEMVMFGENSGTSIENIDPAEYGPGCWFVPRQHEASAQTGFEVCSDDSEEFRRFPDFNDSKPHFQEVFDGQRTDGLMDMVAGNAIFALAMFDGYKDDHNKPVKDWNGGNGANNINDPMEEPFADLGGVDGSVGEEGVGQEPDDNYNLGVYQIVSPTDLDMSTTMAKHVSTFVQFALVDAGFLTVEDIKLKAESGDEDDLFDNPLTDLLDGKDLKLRLHQDLDKYMDDYQLGKQPIGRATPLSAAIYDIHHFFAHGRKGKDSESPLVQDPYKQCRPKHVIMITDGFPEPEVRGEGSVDVGGETVTSAFDYDPNRYPYTYTEEAIDHFVRDRKYDGGQNNRTTPGSAQSYLAADWSTPEGVRFNPRVHVVGLKVGEDDTNFVEIEEEAIEKLAAMAMAGETCAGAYLNDDWKVEEGCDLSERVCLDPRQKTIMEDKEYDYLTPDNTEEECSYPALILTTDRDPEEGVSAEQNLVSATASALNLIFNGILSVGISSRTRPTFVNNLDDPKAQVGGQYRFFSGSSVDIGEVFWRGLLYRNSNLCASYDDDPIAVHDQIEEHLAGDTDSGSDNRRIFTSFATPTSFDYQDDAFKPLVQTGANRDRFMFSMDLTQTDAGEFGTTYLGAQPAGLLDRRVPFELGALEKALDNINSGSSLDTDITTYFQTLNDDQLEDLIDEVRGRSKLKEGRAFGAILNSSPRAVEPPQLDLPIESYRAFRSTYGERPSMLYVSTTDGMLHALHAGELKNSETKDDQVVLRRGGSDSSQGSMHHQREAWAYIPQMLHNDLALSQGKQPYLMDGTPVVSDVRLCHASKEFNQNAQACCTAGSTNCNQDGFDQWRSVLVSGLGEAGAGYFALDVTRPGGNHPQGDGTSEIKAPDPIPLWEFDPNWERGQVEAIAGAGGSSDHAELVYPSSNFVSNNDGFISDCSKEDDDDEYFWNQPFMGASVGEPAIGTVTLYNTLSDIGAQTLRRPVAVFSGGASASYGTPCDLEQRSGRAIYVVDLQTGTLLRRFVTYFADTEDADDVEKRFEYPVSGSPALYDSFPGSLVTRGFVGDDAGRLFRIDLSSPDPADWKAELFFDPAEDIDWAHWDDDPDQFGPASYKPALALGTQSVDNDLLVFYGLGERGDLSAGGQTQLMIAVREKIDSSVNNSVREVNIEGDYLWHAEFQDANDDSPEESDYIEKLTGAPVVFNRGVYFTTYVEPSENRCEPGFSRIYGMKFEGARDDGAYFDLQKRPEGLFAVDSESAAERGEVTLPAGTSGHRGPNRKDNTEPFWAYQPENTNNLTEAVVVRGLTVTLGASCSGNPEEVGGSVTSQNKKPTLMAQSSTGMTDNDRDVAAGTSTASDQLFAIEQDLLAPQSQHIPLSWSAIDN